MHSLATSRLAARSAPVCIALPYARNRQAHRSYANSGKAAADSSVPTSEAVKLGNNQLGAST
jgi:hypothetical protein